jgi:biopolymer transport protein ExbD
MTWKIRHEGSPRAIQGLTEAQIIEGLREGLWEATDEVVGPQESDWVALESHPHFADIAADLEPPPPKHHEDETRLDMNPLIDVCLVLLIFFILTTSYAALQRVLDLPGISAKKLEGPPVVTKEKVKEFMIKVEARQQDGFSLIRVEDEVVEPSELVGVLRRYVKDTRKTELLIDAADVNWGTVVTIQDAAKGAGVQRAHLLTQPASK